MMSTNNLRAIPDHGSTDPTNLTQSAWKNPNPTRPTQYVGWAPAEIVDPQQKSGRARINFLTQNQKSLTRLEKGYIKKLCLTRSDPNPTRPHVE